MKDKIITGLFLIIIFISSFSYVIFKDKEISNYERRKLSNVEDLKEDFFVNLDEYMSDQFHFRNQLISLNNLFTRYILNNYESNDVYIKSVYLIDKEYPLDKKSVNDFISKINYIKDKYLSNSNTYYSIIPDKAYFLDSDKYLKLDYDSLFEKLKSEVNIDYIDIEDMLELEDYYKTDIHLKQKSYFDIVKKINTYYGNKEENLNYREKVYDNFYGSSSSKVYSFFPSDKLEYYVNEELLSIKAKHLEYGLKDIYDESMLSGVDSYNLFLSGPSSLIEIENDKAFSDKEIIVFRDSFGSSLSPLLVPYYRKVTLIDLRYISMDLVSNYVDFNDKDVLILYSTLIVNNSNLLKVNVKSGGNF